MKTQIHDVTIELVNDSLLNQDVDVIVNAANTKMRGGKGIDGAVHTAAGSEMLDELIKKAPQGAAIAELVVTSGYNLSQPWVFHIAGPIYGKDPARKESYHLHKCYWRPLVAASLMNLDSVGFCSISTGAYKYPLEFAAELALDTIAEWIRQHRDSSITTVVIALKGDYEYEVWSDIFKKKFDLKD